MLAVERLSKHYPSSRGNVQALKDVSFTLAENDALALIGESGSGKSTLAEIIIGLQKQTEGVVKWFEQDVDQKRRDQEIQYIFQNPDRSLNPYWKIEDLLLEPLLLNKVKRKEALQTVERMIEMVELPQSILARYPHECSGGQKQRIAIGRTLTQKPKLLIADEMTASLDPMTEKTIIQLLQQIKQELKMSLLFITHRIHTVHDLADEVIVLKDGEIVEKGCTNEMLCSPKEYYTQCLIEACQYRKKNERMLEKGEGIA